MSTSATSGRWSRDCLLEARAVTDHRGRLDPGLGQQPGEPFPEQDGVVGDHDPHGNLAWTRVPPAGAVGHLQRPARRFGSVADALHARAAGVGAASSVVFHGELEPSIGDVHIDSDPRRARVLLGVGDRLARHEPGTCFQLVTEACLDGVDVDGHRGPSGEVVEGGGDAPVAQHHWMQAVGQVAQLGDRRLQLLDAVSSSKAESVVAAVELRRLQRHRQRQQPLLGPVVQVALEPSPFGRLRRRDTGP